MTDTSDEHIFNSMEVAAGEFQDRIYGRFISAAISVCSEEVQIFASGSVSAGTVIPLPSTAGLVAGMTIANLTTQANIGPNITVASVQAGVSATASGNVTVAVNDQLVFNTAGISHATHLKRLAFAGALFARNIDPKILAMIIMSNTNIRTEALAANNVVGGNIVTADIDNQVSAVLTGIASSRNW